MNKNKAIVVVKCRLRYNRNEPNVFLLPVIITSYGVLNSYARYAYENRAKSKKWHEDSARAVALFMRYTLTKKNDFKNPVELFKSFRDAIELGTVDPITKEDPTELRWEAKTSIYTQRLIHYITAFNEYNYMQAKISVSGNDKEIKSILINPRRQANFLEKQINLAAYHHKNSNSFLSHLFDRDKNKKNNINNFYEVSSLQKNLYSKGSPLYTFPESKIFDLLNSFPTKCSSYKKSLSERFNLRDMLITMLLHYGGLRVSEPFHLYVSDIMENPNHKGEALVKLHHPSQAKSPDPKQKRINYLGKYGLRPRNDPRNLKRYYSGWKIKGLTEYTTIKWFPVEAGCWFWSLWLIYLRKQRISPPKGKIHPFAFTQRNGDPASYPAYLESHKHAVWRIGLSVGKEQGTTPHAHRHTYASAINEATNDSVLLQKALNHTSPLSQERYKHRSDEKIRRILVERYDALKQGFASLSKESISLHENYPHVVQNSEKKFLARFEEDL